MIFESGNVEDLRTEIKEIIKNPSKLVEMGKMARQMIEEELNAEIHYKKLMGIYELAIEKSRRKYCSVKFTK